MDDSHVTEPAETSESVIAVKQPPSASKDKSATAVTQPIPVVTSERCSQCAAPLAVDQRYCLQCGAPRPHVNGPISGGRPGGTPSQSVSSPHPPSVAGAPPQSPLPGTLGAPPGMPPGFAPGPAAGRNNTLALLAGIGVLLLAMGVGVLIGRADSGSAKVPAPQVISVNGAAAAGSSTTATTPATAPSETPAAATAKKAAKSSSSSSSSSNSGASLAKPAPPTVLKSVSKGQSGSNYEQKSKNLPDVVETG
jgi:hypothetical protein